jgi:Secretion system C-terminal sorting domain
MNKIFKTWSSIFLILSLCLILLTGCEKDEPIPSDNIAGTASKVEIYPNPSDGIFYLETSTAIKQSELFNAMGQAIKGSVFHNCIDLSANPSGIYFLRTTDQNGNIAVSKLIKSN